MQRIERSIVVIRGQKVMLDADLAELSSVLRSRRAVQVNLEIMRAFVRLRGLMATHKELAAKLEELEQRVDRHDQRFQSVFEAIRQLLEPPTPEQKTRRIGFAMPTRSSGK